MVCSRNHKQGGGSYVSKQRGKTFQTTISETESVFFIPDPKVARNTVKTKMK